MLAKTRLMMKTTEVATRKKSVITRIKITAGDLILLEVLAVLQMLCIIAKKTTTRMARLLNSLQIRIKSSARRLNNTTKTKMVNNTNLIKELNLLAWKKQSKSNSQPIYLNKLTKVMKTKFINVSKKIRIYK